MTVGQRTDPDVGPGGRNDQRADAAQLAGLSNRPAVGPQVAKCLASPDAADAGLIVAGVTQPGLAGRLDGGGHVSGFQAVAFGSSETLGVGQAGALLRARHTTVR